MPYKNAATINMRKPRQETIVFLLSHVRVQRQNQVILHRSIISNVSRLESWNISKLSLPLHMYWHQRKSI